MQAPCTIALPYAGPSLLAALLLCLKRSIGLTPHRICVGLVELLRLGARQGEQMRKCKDAPIKLQTIPNMRTIRL